MSLSVLIVLLSLACSSLGGSSNKFEATRGCLQYNTDHGYSHRHPYFPSTSFRNLNVSENITTMRLGVLGPNDGHVRLSKVMYPYDNTEMNEIVLSGWANTKTVVRRYTRISPSEKRGEDIVLKEQSSIGMLSYFEPFMFTMSFYPGGLVRLTRDGDAIPFLEFRDAGVSANYVGFSNWDKPLVFFYDCPLELDARSSLTRLWEQLIEILEAFKRES